MHQLWGKGKWKWHFERDKYNLELRQNYRIPFHNSMKIYHIPKFHSEFKSTKNMTLIIIKKHRLKKSIHHNSSTVKIATTTHGGNRSVCKRRWCIQQASFYTCNSLFVTMPQYVSSKYAKDLCGLDNTSQAWNKTKQQRLKTK